MNAAIQDAPPAAVKHYESIIPRMRPGPKNKWVSALLTPGMFEQGYQTLHEVVTEYYSKVAPYGQLPVPIEYHHWCCLGVGADQCPDGIRTSDNLSSGSRKIAYNGETAYLPTIVQDWFGFPDQHWFSEHFYGARKDPTIFKCMSQEGHEESWTLAGLNDSHFTFAQIADVIKYFL